MLTKFLSCVTSLTLIHKTIGEFDGLIPSDKQNVHSNQQSVMSEEFQRGMREPPPASQPPMGQRVVPDQFAYIPGQERSFGYCQPNIRPHHLHPNASPSNTGHNSGPYGSFPPPPSMVDHHNLSTPPPMFSRPPQRFTQPPPAMPRTPNIPYQAAFPNPSMMAPREGNAMWHQHNAPPVPQWPHLQVDKGPALITHPVIPEGTAGRHTMGQDEEEDSQWLEEFEKRVESCPPPPPPPTESTTTKKNVKLADVQRLLLESCSLKEQLSGLEEELIQVSSSAEEEEWDRFVQQAEEIKVSLNQILENFQNQEFVEHTKSLLKQRRVKRNRVKRRKKQIQPEKEELKRKREEEEAKIDAWQAKLQREEDSKRREEAVKREADSVLSEVRQKQNEGQRMLQLLEALARLRCTRVIQAAAQGQPMDAEADQRFTSTTEMIGKIVKQQLKEYELEEQTLRVMMEESASHRSAAISAKGDANFARYEDSIRKLLFGPTAAADTHEDAGLSLETLVKRRQEWDQFVVDGDHLLASAVPVSWVLPPAQPDPSWATFLKR